MALQKIEKSNFFLRVRGSILGKEKPDMLTRVSGIIGAVIWVYLFSWHLLTFLSLVLINTLEQSKSGSNGPETIKAAYQFIGKSEYGTDDTIQKLLLHSSIQMIIYGIVLIGLILIYRKLRLGFFLFIIPLISTFMVSYLIFGWKYLENEVGLVNTIIILSIVIYFGLGLFIFYRKTED